MPRLHLISKTREIFVVSVSGDIVLTHLGELLIATEPMHPGSAYSIILRDRIISRAEKMAIKKKPGILFLRDSGDLFNYAELSNEVVYIPKSITLDRNGIFHYYEVESRKIIVRMTQSRL